MFAAYRIDDAVAGRRTACRYRVSRGPAFNYLVTQRDSNVALVDGAWLHVALRKGVPRNVDGDRCTQGPRVPFAAHCVVSFKTPCALADRLCVSKSSSAWAF